MKQKYIVLILAIFVFQACTGDHRVEFWEQEQNGIEVLQILSLQEPEPFTAADSASVIELKYQMMLQEKIAHNALYLKELRDTYAIKVQESKTLSNPLMQQAFQKGLESMAQRIVRLEAVLHAYRSAPEETGLAHLLLEKNLYEIHCDSILGYTQSCTFRGKEGALPKQVYKRKYFLGQQMEIVAEMK